MEATPDTNREGRRAILALVGRTVVLPGLGAAGVGVGPAGAVVAVTEMLPPPVQ